MKVKGSAIFWLAAAVLVGIAAPSAVYAQAVAVAQVSGHVADASAGAVVGAQISALETTRGIVHATVSDPAGTTSFLTCPLEFTGSK